MRCWKGPPLTNLRCSLPTSRALPTWGHAAGFDFSPILRLWRPNAMRLFGLAFNERPFPARNGADKGTKAFFVDL